MCIGIGLILFGLFCFFGAWISALQGNSAMNAVDVFLGTVCVVAGAVVVIVWISLQIRDGVESLQQRRYWNSPQGKAEQQRREARQREADRVYREEEDRRDRALRAEKWAEEEARAQRLRRAGSEAPHIAWPLERNIMEGRNAGGADYGDYDG